MSSRVTKEIVLALHEHVIERFGGASGVRDEGLLEAAIAQPWQTFDRIDFYPTIEEKAARLCFEIVTQHPFVDGNKRTGALLMGVLLRINKIRFKPANKDYYKIIIDVAAGNKDYEDLRDFVIKESKKINQ